MRWLIVTPVKIVGGNSSPSPAAARRLEHLGALLHAARHEPRIVPSCSFELMAPTSVFLSSGSPTRRTLMRFLSLATTSVGHRLVHEQARAGAADVALVEEDAVDDALDRLVDRRVVEHDVRRLAAELHRHLLVGAGERAHDDLADLGRAGEGDLSPRSGAPSRRRRSRPAGDEVDHAGRQAGVLEDLGELERGDRVVSAGLMTTQLPIASAGASFHASMSSGKFHGMTWPTTPSGATGGPGRRTRACPPSPRGRRNAPPPSARRSRATP
jgi:hypothetical protein